MSPRGPYKPGSSVLPLLFFFQNYPNFIFLTGPFVWHPMIAMSLNVMEAGSKRPLLGALFVVHFSHKRPQNTFFYLVPFFLT